MTNVTIKVTSPLEWFSIPVTNPAYIWLVSFVVVL